MKLLVVLIFISSSATSSFAAPREQRPPEYLVGVYYFAGWWEEQPNKYTTQSQDWRPQWPGRTALLGEYNDQKTMDREIVAASEHGVHFFQILWYFQGNSRREPNQEKLNNGIKQFMASPENGRMKFTIEYTNRPPFGIYSDKDWDAACREWCACFKHPSYLRLEGKAVFTIYGVDFFWRDCEGKLEKVKARLDRLRAIARELDVGELLIAGGVGAGAVADGDRIAPYDFLTTYMDTPPLRMRQEPYRYEELIAFAKKSWKEYGTKCKKPYVPYLPVGWDPRPWHYARPSFDAPSDLEWLAALRDAQAALDQFPNLGVPLSNSARQKMLLIYAWNEFGEGGIVAPTFGNNQMPLHAIHRVFGNAGN